jgi:hypothetical protein
VAIGQEAADLKADSKGFLDRFKEGLLCESVMGSFFMLVRHLARVIIYLRRHNYFVSKKVII